MLHDPSVDIAAAHPFAGLRLGQYGLIYADPATKFSGGTKGRPQHYKRMTRAELLALPVRDLAAKNCWLFIWTTTPQLLLTIDLIKAWGFKFSANGFVWAKTTKSGGWHMGQGYTTRKNAELCLLAKRGHPARLARDVRELVVAPRREHSRKPDIVRTEIERFAAGPYVELFSRSGAEGWDAWGDELNKFNGGTHG
jgi:N6-adenosine-specific RNA methylase IME4